MGLWDLTGSEVRIRVQGSDAPGLRLFRSEDGASSWPEPPTNADDAASWRDARFLADMTAIAGDGRINPELLATVAGTLPRGVSARIHLDAGLIEAGLPSREEYRDEVFEFAATETRGTLRQALSDTIRWSLDARAEAVVIEIAPVSGGPVRRLVLKPRDAAHQAFIGNLPVHDAQAHDQHALSDETLAALHFGAYYELLQQAPEHATHAQAAHPACASCHRRLVWSVLPAGEISEPIDATRLSEGGSDAGCGQNRDSRSCRAGGLERRRPRSLPGADAEPPLLASGRAATGAGRRAARW